MLTIRMLLAALLWCKNELISKGGFAFVEVDALHPGWKKKSLSGAVFLDEIAKDLFKNKNARLYYHY
ncbi:MAG TPA: hypothetical protein EYH36_09360 [Desulfocapsa sulfexigens]|nr:hypothetical protein [Desulfocapsa sulfexigens]